MDDTEKFNQVLDQYVNSLIEKKGLSELSEDKRTILADKLKDSLIDQINKEILRRLPDDKLAEFEKTLDDDDKSMDDLSKIVDSANIDMDDLTKSVASEFGKAFLEEEM